MSLHMKVVVGPLANVAMIRSTDQVSRMLPMSMTIFGKSIIVYARKSSSRTKTLMEIIKKKRILLKDETLDWLQNCTAASSLNV